MAVNLLMAPEAEHDVSDAYDWYEGRRVGLGEDFLARLEACFQAIRFHTAQDPQKWRQRLK